MCIYACLLGLTTYCKFEMSAFVINIVHEVCEGHAVEAAGLKLKHTWQLILVCTSTDHQDAHRLYKFNMTVVEVASG